MQVNKEIIVQKLMAHETVTRRAPVISQLCEGLKSLSFLDLVRQMPSIFDRVFVHQKETVTPDNVLSLITFPEKDEDQKSV